MNPLKRQFQNLSADYRGNPFLSWNGDPFFSNHYPDETRSSL
jgi:hypothetical protein